MMKNEKLQRDADEAILNTRLVIQATHVHVVYDKLKYPDHYHPSQRVDVIDLGISALNLASLIRDIPLNKFLGVTIDYFDQAAPSLSSDDRNRITFDSKAGNNPSIEVLIPRTSIKTCSHHLANSGLPIINLEFLPNSIDGPYATDLSIIDTAFRIVSTEN